MKTAILTDTHFGARNDNIAFAGYFSKFYENIFFPYLKKHNIVELECAQHENFSLYSSIFPWKGT